MGWTRRYLRLDQKPVALGEARAIGVRCVLIYCGNSPNCQHQAELDADRWPDDVPFGQLQPRMLCTACGHLGADVRPLWPIGRKGYGGPHP